MRKKASGACLGGAHAVLALVVLAGALGGVCVAKDLHVDSPEGIRNALAAAEPGDAILVKLGAYDMSREFATGRDGTREKPITFACDSDKGYAELQAASQIAFRVRSRFWVIRGIHVKGCSPPKPAAGMPSSRRSPPRFRPRLPVT